MLFGGKKDQKTWQGRRKGKLIAIQLSEELYTELDTLSKKYGISKAQLIRDALVEKIKRLETA